MSSSGSPEKEIQETHDGYAPANGMRERRRDPNQVARKDHNNGLGGAPASELDHNG